MGTLIKKKNWRFGGYSRLRGGRYGAEHEFENPFEVSLNLNAWDIAKVTVNFLWLFPLRLLLFAFPSLVAGIVLCAIVSIGRQNNERPLTGWRKFLLSKVGYMFNRLLLFGLGFNWIRVLGQPAPTDVAPVAVAAPHSSLFDMFLVSLKSMPSFITRMENKTVPIFGRLEECVFKCIFVSRTDHNRNQTCKDEIARRMNSEHTWPPIMFFPEGTTTNRKSIIHFKHGAFGLKTAVQPILIRFNNRMNTMMWGDNTLDLAKGILLTFCQFHNSVTIEYMPVYHPSNEEKDNPIVYAANVRKLMSDAMSIPLSDHTYEDVLLMRESKRLGMPYGAGEVEYAKNCRPYNITSQQLKKLLKRFARMDTDKDGLVSHDNFALFLRMPIDTCLRSVFTLLDKDSTGQISFLQYSRLLIHSRSFLEDEQFLKQIFQFFDEDNDGFIASKDLHRLLPIQPNEHYLYSFNDDSTIKKCSLLSRCRRYSNSTLEMNQHDEELGEETGSLILLDVMGLWNYDHFKQLLTDNLEYLLLFNEYHNVQGTL